MQVVVIETGASALRVEVNEAVPSAEFLCGVIEAIAGYAGAKTCGVDFADEPPLVVFSVCWS